MLRYQRLGEPQRIVDTTNDMRGVQNCLKLRKKNFNEDTVRRSLAKYAHDIATNLYLRDEVAECQAWAKRVLEFTDDYFFGGWRDTALIGPPEQASPPDRTYWDCVCSWDNEFLACLQWGSALGDWTSLKKVAGYFKGEMSRNIDQSDPNWAWLQIVAGVLQERDWDALSPFRNLIQNSTGRGKREKLLLAILEALLEKSESDANRAAEEYFSYFKKTELKSLYASLLLQDGTFLIHWAEHRGQPITIPEKVLDHVVRF